MKSTIQKKVRIGSGAGYSGDRIEPAVELARKGDLNYLVFECLAERTIAIALKSKRENPDLGYDPLLEERMVASLPVCSSKGIRIITNMGAANPVSAMQKTADIARGLGLKGMKLAAVSGDDVLELISRGDFKPMEAGDDLEAIKDRIVSANAYLGAGPVVEALEEGARVIITGRVADPALFMAPAIYEFGWSFTDWDLLGKGTIMGHLLECAGQITGGSFADPGLKDVPGLARLGFPIGEVDESGSLVITKLEGSGGRVSAATCSEQLLYEIHDPARYLTPDVVADFSAVTVEELGPDRVELRGATGRERPETLKLSVGYRDGWLGEGQISYAGPGAAARARLALEVVAERLKLTGVRCREVRYELVGLDALHGARLSAGHAEPWEVRARVAARTDDAADAARIGREVESLYTNGPAGGGGVSRQAREIVAVASAFVPREWVVTEVEYLEA
jgi:Acyclic terpene utilisation family protein AtuA